MLNKRFLSTTQVAKLLGISRISVFNRIKKGDIKAEKVGRNFIINRNEVAHLLGEELSDNDKKEIDKAVQKTVKEYGETLKLLGNS
jgi:excisionase family DNA binding protein